LIAYGASELRLEMALDSDRLRVQHPCCVMV
jgi:hypothetical protein